MHSEAPYYNSLIEYVSPIDLCSGTVHNTRVSARKDGPRARIAYSIHWQNQHAPGRAAVLSTATGFNGVLTDFKAVFISFVLNV